MSIENVWPKSREELFEFISDKLNNAHDYNSAADALAEVTLAAFNYASRELGVTGFQASHADLLFLAATRNIDGPFALIKAQDLLYPQYDIPERVEDYINNWMPWAAEKAQELLNETPDDMVSPQVKARWIDLAEQADR